MQTPTRYSDLTTEQKLALDNEAFLEAVKIEGVSRGIKPPITLSAALMAEGYAGFQIMPDAVIFYEIVKQGPYSGDKRTGLCFRTADQARTAMQGAVSVEEEGYGENRRMKLTDAEFAVSETYLALGKPKNFSKKIEEYFQDDTEFDKLCEECRDDLLKLKQEAYDTKVRSEKRAMYLSLAKGDEEIASSFWARTETGSWPAA